MHAKLFSYLLIGIVAIAAIANIAGTIFFWPRATSDEKALQFALCAANGFLFGQASLIGVWWSSANQPIVRRTKWSAGVFVVLFLSYILTINSVNTGSDIYLPLFFLAIATGVIGLVSLSHWIASRFLRVRITSRSNTTSDRLTFDLKQLFLTTTIAAVLCAIFRFAFPAMEVGSALPIPWRAYFDFVLAITVLLTGISLMATFCVFTNRPLVWLFGLLFLFLAPMIVVELLVRYSASAFGPITISTIEIVLFIDTCLVAFFLTSFSVLFCLKTAGSRLEKI